MTLSESDLDTRLRSLGEELDRRSRSHHSADKAKEQRSRGPLVAAGILATLTIVGLVALTERDASNNVMAPSASNPQPTGSEPGTPPTQPGDAVLGSMTFESMPVGFSLTHANADAFGGTNSPDDFGVQTRIYTADLERPDTAATFVVITGPADLADSDVATAVATISVHGVDGSLFDDPNTGGRSLRYVRDGQFYTITGYRVTDSEIVTAAANTGPAGPSYDNYGAVIDPAGLPVGVTEFPMGAGWFERWLIFKDALSQPVPAARWESGTTLLWFYGLQTSPQSLPLTRIGWTRVTDTTVHGQPAFIVTTDSDPGFRGVNWIEGDITYLVGSRGLDDTQLLELVEQLRPATTDEWTEMLTASDAYQDGLGATPASTISVTPVEPPDTIGQSTTSVMD